MASFAAQRVVSAVSWEDHIVHLEGSPPSGCWTPPCERKRIKDEGQNLSFQGLNFLPEDVAALLLHLEESASKFSRKLFHQLDS